ncbi:hypothetical protein KAT92_06595 [Candidatus Babeliales bacterium]|nr:hypothetical protein [Candidatus Babeliales bacterium]
MRLVRQSLNYSRQIRAYILEGKGNEAKQVERLGDILAKIEGVDAVEYSDDPSETYYTLVVNTENEQTLKDTYRRMKMIIDSRKLPL